MKLPDRYEAEEASDVSARRRALVSMQRALIKGQEIGDEKLQVLKSRGEGGGGGRGATRNYEQKQKRKKWKRRRRR